MNKDLKLTPEVRQTLSNVLFEMGFKPSDCIPAASRMIADELLSDLRAGKFSVIGIDLIRATLAERTKTFGLTQVEKDQLENRTLRYVIEGSARIV